MLNKLHWGWTKTGCRKIGCAKDPVRNFPGQINDWTIQFEEKELTLSLGPTERTKKRVKRPSRFTLQVSTPAKPTTKSGRKEEVISESTRSRKNSMRRSGKLRKKPKNHKRNPGRRRRYKTTNPLHMESRHFTLKVNHGKTPQTKSYTRTRRATKSRLPLQKI